jgi:MscS family membrane protein
VIFIGVAWSVAQHTFAGRAIIYSIFETCAVVLWTLAGIRITEALLGSVARSSRPYALVQQTTLPVFDMIAKILMIGIACYFTFLAWDINVSAWLASAGIVGIAVGFAAQDTLANMIAGIVILADGIYRVGDFIVLEKDQTLRGRVSRIGLRSTRIVTLDNIEITVPNADIGKSKVVNEVGGESVKQRIRALVSVAYGSDVDRVFEVLRGCTAGLDRVCESPTPDPRFVNFGASGLDFELLVWIVQPEQRDAILSQLNVRIYKALGAAGIEIPYSKHDVYIKEMPGQLPGAKPGAKPSADE